MPPSKTGVAETGGRDLQLFSALHRTQARMYRRMQASLMQRIDAAEDGPNWKMPAEMRAELAEIDAFLARH